MTAVLEFGVLEFGVSKFAAYWVLATIIVRPMTFVIRFPRSSIAAAAIALALVATLQPVDTASAGELIRSPRRFSSKSTYTRKVAKSTEAVRRLKNTPSSDRPMSLKQSNPYEYRIVQAAMEQQKYEQKLAKWENRVEKQEQRAVVKRQKETARAQDRLQKKNERERAKAAREQAKRERDKEKQLARIARNQSPLTTTTKKNGERFSSPTGAEKEGAPRRLSLWQRIKLWFSGSGAA